MSEDKIRKIFSKNLTNQLSMHGKTQKDLVDFIHVSSSTVSNWCTGQKLPRMDKIQALANWLGINTSDLIEEKSNVPRQLELDISEEILKIIAKIASDNSTVVYGNSEPLKGTELKIVKEELEMARRRLEILTKK